MNSQIRQNLTVDFDVGFFQASNETAVGQTVDTSSSIDTRDPQSAELAFTLAAVTVRILTSFDDCLFGYAEYARARTVVTFGQLEDLLVTTVCSHTTFDARHSLLLTSDVLCEPY
ncbi:pyruvate-formatelyase-activating enzyme [Zymobacter palmae]|uniref:Pyruvate-formatelyase-activating enzyme n=1 Tax=Zymobacter palmae TaxID=33074 RepID=A0A348HE01_9GAMM|nr:pyruvate-formatelyase-activating enzyme [Zymobacter palmae]